MTPAREAESGSIPTLGSALTMPTQIPREETTQVRSVKHQDSCWPSSGVAVHAANPETAAWGCTKNLAQVEQGTGGGQSPEGAGSERRWGQVSGMRGDPGRREEVTE